MQPKSDTTKCAFCNTTFGDKESRTYSKPNIAFHPACLMKATDPEGTIDNLMLIQKNLTDFLRKFPGWRFESIY